MKARRLTPVPDAPGEADAPPGGDAPDGLDDLRRDRIVYDAVTQLPIHPFDHPSKADERIENLGVIYLQIGKFFGFEELFGWEQYDRVLAAASESLQDDVRASRLAPHVHSIRFSGADGFYVLYNLPPAARGRGPANLEEEAARLRASVARRLRQTLEGTAVDFLNILASSLTTVDNPRVRPSRHVIRTLQEAVKIVAQHQTSEKLELFAGLKTVIGQKQLRPAFQPVRHLPDGAIMGYEALIRGPQGTSLEPPTVLFAVAHENEMDVELETLCLETIFANLPRAVSERRLFVNASAMLLRHPVFLDERNLAAINRSHDDVVVEISEKEMVRDYDSFQEVLSLVRGAKMKIAIDDAGSGYSGLETILQFKPDYIKVADTLVRNIHADPIKREIIASLDAIGKRIGATLVAEGIEVEPERKTLVDLGIEFGQGFLLGRPAFQVSGRPARA
ncbi:MAG TPA: EAL domain-containing protein [Thermoanaerobaculia bacterium]|jgi:EAL domain-containing protein (putative c-di-GMP-specific phosphodiesterase class I)|nr:EAL domain-containing protein [Thermoanaerobaculia bacterium]